MEKMEKNLKLNIIKFFDDLILDKVDIAREQFAEYLNAFVPILKARQEKYLETIHSEEEWAKAKAQIALDCGFWIESKLEGPAANRIQFSTNELHSELSYAASSLVNEFSKITTAKFTFFSELREFNKDGYLVDVCMCGSKRPATIAISNKPYDHVMAKFREFKRFSKQKTPNIKCAKCAKCAKCSAPDDDYFSSDHTTFFKLSTSDIDSTRLVQLLQAERGQTYCFPSFPIWKIFYDMCNDLFMQPCKIRFDKIIFKGHHCDDDVGGSDSEEPIATLLIGTDYLQKFAHVDFQTKCSVLN